MLFALVASGLWIVNSIYSIGYMRGNDETHQTRFYVCFALALAATMGIAFAGNLLTLFLFYEVLTLVTYPLVTHHGTEDARARRARLPRHADGHVDRVPAAGDGVRPGTLAGTLDFIAGRHPRRPGSSDARARRAAGALHVRHRQGGADAVPPLAAGGDGGADAGVGAAARGRGRQGRRVHAWSRSSSTSSASTLLRRPGAGRLAGRASPASRSSPPRWSRCAPDNLKRRLAYSTISQLSYIVLAAALLAPLSVDRRGAAHRRPRVRQDHAVLRRRLDLHRRAQDRGQPARRHRPAHAVDHGAPSPSARCR